MKTKHDNTKSDLQIVDEVDRWPVGIKLSDSRDIAVSVSENMAVILSNEAFEQLFGWAYSTSMEISCLGSVSQQGSVFFIDHFYLLKQSCSSFDTELDQTAVAELIESLIKEGKKQEAQKIKCWAHSHPDMDTFWSHTDDTTCKLMVNNYLVSIVVAGDFQIRCRLDIASPVSVGFDNIPVYYQMPKDDALAEKFAREVKDSVKYVIRQIGTKPNALIGPETADVCFFCGESHALEDCPLKDMVAHPDRDDESEFFI